VKSKIYPAWQISQIKIKRNVQPSRSRKQSR